MSLLYNWYIWLTRRPPGSHLEFFLKCFLTYAKVPLFPKYGNHLKDTLNSGAINQYPLFYIREVL